MYHQADISELENVELLEKIKEMEETELNKSVKKSGGESSLKFSKLEPIQDGGADKLLQAVRGHFCWWKNRVSQTCKEWNEKRKKGLNFITSDWFEFTI